MQALVIHADIGYTHVLMASDRPIDENDSAISAILGTPRSTPAPRSKSVGHASRMEPEPLYIHHDETVRNGADHSLRLEGFIDGERLEIILDHVAQTCSKFEPVIDGMRLTVSRELLDKADLNARKAVDAFQRDTGHLLRVLASDEISLWILRAMRSIYPTDPIAGVSLGYWSTHSAIEDPGRAPKFSDWQLGVSNLPDTMALHPTSQFQGVESITEEKYKHLLLTGEGAWLLGALRLGLTFHAPDIIDDATLIVEDLREYADWLRHWEATDRNTIPMVGDRGDLIMHYLKLAEVLLRRSGCEEIRCCSRGLVHGLILDLFSDARKQLRK